jgi:hypothetical protein
MARASRGIPPEAPEEPSRLRRDPGLQLREVEDSLGWADGGRAGMRCAHEKGPTHFQRRKNGMNDPRLEQRFDTLAVQVHDWTESALALDAGHFPSELLNDLEDLIEELKAFLDEEESSYDRKDVTELFVTPEMAEVIERFPRVRRQLERAWGAQLTELIEEEGAGFGSLDDDDDE